MLQSYKLEQQATVIISSHDLNHIAELCDEVMILEHGEIVAHLRQQLSYEQLREAFLSVTAVSQNIGESVSAGL